jgi:hypothetical protein
MKRFGIAIDIVPVGSGPGQDEAKYCFLLTMPRSAAMPHFDQKAHGMAKRLRPRNEPPFPPSSHP